MADPAGPRPPDSVRVVDLTPGQEAAIAAACGLARPGDRPVTAADYLTALDARQAMAGAVVRLAEDADDGPWHD